MPIPMWALLGFAAWTVLLLLSTIGVYRWSRILTGRVQIRDFRADQVEGDEWYRRAMRAHANCIENLPVFGVIVTMSADSFKMNSQFVPPVFRRVNSDAGHADDVHDHAAANVVDR